MIRLGDVSSMVRSLEKFSDRTVKTAQRELKEPGEVLLEEERSQLDRPGTGRTYTHGRGRLGARLHTASKPGEPPSPDSGALRDSARIELDGERVRVIVTGEGAAALEFGTRQMAPRPYARPALAAARNRMGTAFAARLGKGR